MSKRRLAQVNPQESDSEDTSNHDEHFDEDGKLRKVKWENLSKRGKAKRVFDNVEHGMFVFTKYFCGFWRYVLLSINGFFFITGLIMFAAGVYGFIQFYGVPGIIPSITAGIGGLGLGTVCFSYIGYIGAKMRNKAGSEENGCTILTVYAVMLLLVILMEAFLFGALMGFLTGNDFLMRTAMGEDLADQTMAQMANYMNCSYGDCCAPLIEDIQLASMDPLTLEANFSKMDDYNQAREKYGFTDNSSGLTQAQIYTVGNWSRVMCKRCDEEFYYGPLYFNLSDAEEFEAFAPSPSSSSSSSSFSPSSAFDDGGYGDVAPSSTAVAEEDLYPDCHDEEKMRALCELWDDIVYSDDINANINVCSSSTAFTRAAQGYINSRLFIIIYGGYVIGSLEIIALFATVMQLSWFCRKHKKVDPHADDSDEEWDSDEHDDPDNEHRIHVL